jgi:hypothetical protein
MAEHTHQHDLDAAIRERAQPWLIEGEVIVAWVALAATRRYDGGGVVIHIPSHDVMPPWEARGILAEGLMAVSQPSLEDHGEDQ